MDPIARGLLGVDRLGLLQPPFTLTAADPQVDFLPLETAPAQQLTELAPRGPQYPSHLRTFIDQTKVQLIGKDQFFGAPGQPPAHLDWPVPKGAPPPNTGYVDGSEFWMLKDTILRAPGQGVQNYDQPVPRGAAARPAQVDVNLLPTLLGAILAPFALYEWPVPRGAGMPQDRGSTRAAAVWLIGQDSIYAGPGQVPAYDWQVPRGAAFPMENRGYIDASEFWLLKDTMFGAPGQGVPNYDWPVPKGAAVPLEGRTFLQSLKLLLLGQDLFFGAAGQAPRYDWPNPAVRRALMQDPVANLLALLAGPMPFALLDWPVPRGAAFPLEGRGFLQTLKLLLQGQDTFFGAPGQAPRYDWPNPTPRRGAAPLVPDVNTVAMLLSGVLAPFYQMQWPNPRGVRAVLPPAADQNLRPSLWGTADQVPFRIEATNPTLARRVALEAFGARAPWYLLPPFSLAQWPNPIRRAMPAELLVVPNLAALLAVAPPFRLLEWPLPVRRVVPVQADLHALALQLLGQDAFFGGPGQAPAHMDWPVPRGKAYPASLLAMQLAARFYEAITIARAVLGDAPAFVATLSDAQLAQSAVASDKAASGSTAAGDAGTTTVTVGDQANATIKLTESPGGSS